MSFFLTSRYNRRILGEIKPSAQGDFVENYQKRKKRPAEILKLFKKVEESVLSVKEYFQIWQQYDAPDHKVARYYIDGNVKPLWSSKRCRKGKVVIHDGHGRPLYLRTFSGHADLRENALRTMDELDIVLNKKRESRAKESPGSRALIIDGAGNAVQTLRAFSESDYHYITILDTNQMVDRKFKHLKAPQRYQYGEAFLVDCRIELMDSKESGYLYGSRAVRVQ